MAKIKKASDFLRLFFRTQSRGRTGTTVKLLVFETNASTYSAIRAFYFRQRIRSETGCKCIQTLFNSQQVFLPVI